MLLCGLGICGIALFGSLLEFGLVVTALAAVVHHEEALLVEVLDLLLVPQDVLIVLFLVLLLLLGSKLIPELATLLHGLRVSAALLLLERVHILRRVEKVGRQRFLWHNACLSVLFLGVDVEVGRFLTVLSGEIAFLFELSKLPLVPLLILLVLIQIRFLVLIGHALPDFGALGEGRLLIESLLGFQLRQDLIVEVDPRRSRLLGFQNEGLGLSCLLLGL